MAYFPKFGVVILVLASWLTPSMACMITGAPMAGEEQACCARTNNDCSQKEMTASPACCYTLPGSVYDNAVNTKALALHPSVPVIRLSAHDLRIASTVGHRWLEFSDSIPLRFPSSTISILRI